jgi:hypothetical protein
MRATRNAVNAILGAVLLTAVLVLGNPAPATAADSGTEAAFVARINAIRAQNGLGPVRMYGELQGVARDWTDQMVANGGISHNPNLGGQVSANWRKLGENVGVGHSVDSLMTAFVNSPAHYRNIVDPDFNYIGVGVSYGDDGRMYTTHDFMALDDGSSEPAPAPAQDQSPAPAPKRQASAAPASASTEAAPAEPEAPAPPPPPATPIRVKTVLTALRVVGG